MKKVSERRALSPPWAVLPPLWPVVLRSMARAWAARRRQDAGCYGWMTFAWNLGANKALDACDILCLAGGSKGNGHSRAARTRSTADTVNVIVRVIGKVIIDHESDVCHINATCSDIGCYKNTVFPAFESLERFPALA